VKLKILDKLRDITEKVDLIIEETTEFSSVGRASKDGYVSVGRTLQDDVGEYRDPNKSE